MVFAASAMNTSSFTVFALLTLIAGVTIGLVRAALLQPSLVEQRQNPLSLVPFRYAIFASVLGAMLLPITYLVLGGTSALELCVLGLSAVLPLLADWLRFRRIAVDQRRPVAVADAIRLAFVILAPFTPFAADAIAFQIYLQSSCLVVIAYLAVGHRRLRIWTPYRTYRRAANLQLLDFVVGQANVTIPLLVLGGLGQSTLIAGVRFAQTIFGPLNLVASASVMHLLADGATRTSHSSEASLIENAKKLSLRLGACAILYVGATLIVISIPGFELNALSNSTLLTSTLLVGVVAVVSGWAGIHSIVLRLLGEQLIATGGRSILVTAALVAFAVGFFVGGVDGSLLAGFVTSAVLYPLVFVLPAQVIYRRRLNGRDEI
jgi:hypothetical protein